MDQSIAQDREASYDALVSYSRNSRARLVLLADERRAARDRLRPVLLPGATVAEPDRGRSSMWLALSLSTTCVVCWAVSVMALLSGLPS